LRKHINTYISIDASLLLLKNMFVSQCLGGKGGKLLPALGLKQGHAEPDGKKKTLVMI
jgi:hypothetical protein